MSSNDTKDTSDTNNTNNTNDTNNNEPRRELRKRRSPRKQYFDETEDTTPIESTPVPPKKRRGRPPKATTKRRYSMKFINPQIPDFGEQFIGTSEGIENPECCSFYRIRRNRDGQRVFSKALINYFMKLDSPAAHDLKNKRFNTSFLREIPRGDRDIQIFTEEEDRDPKYLENVPNLPPSGDPGGEDLAHVFDKMPINDSDEEFKQFIKETKNKKRGTRVTYKGNPLPDTALTMNYSDRILESSNSLESNTDDEESSDNSLMDTCNGSILKTLLSSPLDDQMKRYPYSTPVMIKKPAADETKNKLVQSTYNDYLTRKEEDEMYLNQFSHIMGEKRLTVVLTKLPIDDKVLKLCCKKSLKSHACVKEKKQRASKKSVKVPSKKGKKGILRVRLTGLKKKEISISKP